MVRILAAGLISGLLFSGQLGCSGGGNNEIVQAVDVDFVSNIRSDLEAIAKSGRLGSGTQTLMAYARDFAQKDPSKGEPIFQGINELIQLQGEAKIKAKAQELLKLL